MKHPLAPVLAIAVSVLAAAAPALAQQPAVTDAWARATVAQQKATGLFAQIVHPTGGKLVAASSPAAGVVEIHEMAMDGNVMKMRAVASVDLPANQRVELKPGGLHVMLMDLKQPLKAGDTLPVSLVFEGKDGKRETLEVKAAVKALAAMPAAMGAGHKH